MNDVQSSIDLRNLPIDQVGIKDLRFPIQIRTPQGTQHTVAHLTLTVSLPAHQKGTHMSRFVALMEEHQTPMDFDSLKQLTGKMLEKLNAENGKIKMAYPYFRQKTAPISRIQSLLDYDVTLTGEWKNGEYHCTQSVLIPVTTLCPCSKEISEYGAHNQRSHITVTFTSNEHINIDDIIATVEEQASCQLYGLLKRPDEKFVTEHAYENPKFVEDMVRDVVVSLKKDSRIKSFTVESENFESIHNHSAYAIISHP